MSEAKFTKGEWSLSIDENLSLSMNGSTEMCDIHYYPWCPSNKYDWHLIAVAPEMYEMLKRLSAKKWDASEEEEIENLLAKARGEK